MSKMYKNNKLTKSQLTCSWRLESLLHLQPKILLRYALLKACTELHCLSVRLTLFRYALLKVCTELHCLSVGLTLFRYALLKVCTELHCLSVGLTLFRYALLKVCTELHCLSVGLTLFHIFRPVIAIEVLNILICACGMYRSPLCEIECFD